MNSPAGIPLTVDPALRPGTMLIRTGGEQAIADTTSAGIFQLPEFAEDLESLRESMPYMIRYLEATGPILCECCGTSIHAVPESGYVTPRRWRRAVWEPGTGRKHTIRRCDRMRQQALSTREG